MCSFSISIKDQFCIEIYNSNLSLLPNNIIMNVFEQIDVAQKYDAYYHTEFGKEVNRIEEQLITHIIKDFPKSKILELGCGTGHWTEILLKKGHEVIAGDISKAMLDIAKSKNLKAEILEINSENIPFNNNSFDVVVSITMLEFVENQTKVIEEIKRVLKPGGWFILGSLNSLSAIGQNSANDPTFKDAKFLSEAELIEKLSIIGKTKINKGVYLSNDFEILDNKITENIEPAFIASATQKTK